MFPKELLSNKVLIPLLGVLLLINIGVYFQKQHTDSEEEVFSPAATAPVASTSPSLTATETTPEEEVYPFAQLDITSLLQDSRYSSFQTELSECVEYAAGENDSWQPRADVHMREISEEVRLPDYTVYILRCMMHAYNTSDFLVIDRAGVLTPVLIEKKYEEEGLVTSYIGSGLQYLGDNHFSSFHKHRGIGDCFSENEYRLEGDRLVLARAFMVECDGDPDGKVIYSNL